MNVKQMITKCPSIEGAITAIPLLFLVTLARSQKSQESLSLNSLAHISIKIEAYLTYIGLINVTTAIPGSTASSPQDVSGNVDSPPPLLAATAGLSVPQQLQKDVVAPGINTPAPKCPPVAVLYPN